MRGRYFFALFSVLLVFFLSGCTKVINSRADELRTYVWQGEMENGDSATLRFDDRNAELAVNYPDTAMIIEGFCAVSEESLTIYDEASGFDYTFTYKLYGDRVELSCDSGQISLKKMK